EVKKNASHYQYWCIKSSAAQLKVVLPKKEAMSRCGLLWQEVPRPWIGLELSDLDIIELGELEKLIHSSPDTLSGVLVRKVELRSPASDAGICTEDLIIQIDGKHVGSPLEFTSVLLDKAKEPREVIVKRAGSITPLKLTVLPQSAGKLNRIVYYALCGRAY
ncbi:protease Do-like 14-like protein, partial [Trifolium pratense]